MTKQTLIIGYGNPLRGDDGLGWEVAGRLAACIPDPAVTIVTAQQLTPELSEPIYYADTVIFVDATAEGKPGTWRCELIEPAIEYAPSMGHHFDIAGLLAFTRGVFQSCPKAWVVSVTAESFACREDLSPMVEEALTAVVRHIRQLILELNPRQEPSYA